MEAEVITACENVCRDFYWLGPVTDWLRNVAIILGVIIAAYQISAWRREHLYKARAEIALDLFNAANETARHISSVRAVMESMPPGSTFPERVEHKLRKYWDGYSVVEDLKRLLIKADAFLGRSDVVEAVELLLTAVGETQGTFLTLKGYDGKRTGDLDADEFYSKLILLMHERKDDKIMIKQAEAMDTLRTILFPIIRLERR